MEKVNFRILGKAISLAFILAVIVLHLAPFVRGVNAISNANINYQGASEAPIRSPQLRYQYVPPVPLKLQKGMVKSLSTVTTAVDIVFAIDNTGSMGSAIGTVKSDVQNIVDRIRAEVPDSRFGAIKFRDHGDTFLTEIVSQPTTDINAFKSGINTMSASAGGDTPEAYIDVIFQGVDDVSWRSTGLKLLVVVGDAPPHDPIYGTGSCDCGRTWSQASSAASNAGIHVSMVAVGYGVGDSDVYQSYNYMVNATVGRYVESSDPTEVSNALIDLINALSGETPMVINTDPASNSTEVPLDKTIKATFNMDMDLSTINNKTVYLDAGHSCVPVSISYDSTTRILSIDPVGNLAFNHKYTVVLGNGLTSTSGRSLSTYQWSFETQPVPPRERVVKALESLRDECITTINVQRDRTAYLISNGSSRLNTDEFINLFNDAVNIFLDFKVGKGLLKYGPLEGMSPQVRHRLAVLRDFKNMTPILLTKYGFKYYSHEKALLDYGANARSFDFVQNDLENNLEHFGDPIAPENDPPVLFRGVNQIKIYIQQIISTAIAKVPETVNDSQADEMVAFLEEQKAMLVRARNEEVFPAWFNKPLGHLISYKEEYEGAIHCLEIEEGAKITVTIAKATGLILKGGGIAALFTGAGAPVGGLAFSIGEKLYWGATIADLAWTGVQIVDTFEDIILTPKEHIQAVLVEVRDSLEDEDWLMIEFVEGTLSEIERLSLLTSMSLASTVRDRTLSIGSLEEEGNPIEVVSFGTPNIRPETALPAAINLGLRNTGPNSIRCTVSGKIYGPETLSYGRAIVGIVGSKESIEIGPMATEEFSLSYTGIPLLSSGLTGCQAVIEIFALDTVTGTRWTQGPIVSNFYVLTAEEESSLGDLKSSEALNGTVSPGIRQEIQLNVPANLQSILFSLPVAEGTDADLHLFDSAGNHVGLNYAAGVVENTIPGSGYSGPDVKAEYIRVNSPTPGIYVLRVVGQSGPAIFTVSKVEVPLLPAVFAADGHIKGLGIQGGLTDISISVREIGGVQDVTGLTILLGALSNGSGNVIGVDKMVLGSYPSTITKGSGHLIPLSISIPGSSPVDTYSGTITVQSSAGSREIQLELMVISSPSTVPGDCNGDGQTTIDEVQKCINQFLGISPVEACCDLNGDGQVTIDEVQKVINAFLGL
jgi:hypothetical protein